MSNSMIDRESNGDEGNAANVPQSGRVFLLRDRDSLFPRRALGGSEDAIEALAGIAAEAVGMGIRRAFRIPLAIMVVVALSALSLFSYQTLSSSELDRAEQSVRSEINYLCLQLQSLDERSEAFPRVADMPTGPFAMATTPACS